MVNLGDQLGVKTLKVSGTDTAASTNGSAVDLQAWADEFAIVLNSAKGSGNADNTLDVKIQDSADGSTGWNDISGAAFTQVLGSSGTDSTQLMSLNKNEIKRYIRYVSTMAGTSKSFAWGCIAVGLPKYL